MSSHDGVCEPSANSQRLSFQGRTANTYTTQGIRISISIKIYQDVSSDFGQDLGGFARVRQCFSN